MDERAPVLISKNLFVTNLADVANAHLLPVAPFGKEGFLVITRGGSAVFHTGIDPAALHVGSLSNAVLRP